MRKVFEVVLRDDKKRNIHVRSSAVLVQDRRDRDRQPGREEELEMQFDVLLQSGLEIPPEKQSPNIGFRYH